MSNGKKGLGRGQIGGRAYSNIEKQVSAASAVGSTISDADQKFIARMNTIVNEDGKSISDGDQKRYKRLTGKNWPGGGRTISDRDLSGGRALSVSDYKKLHKEMQGDLPGGRTTSDRLRKHGGPVKKYAKGGGVRKARYK